MTEKIRSLKNAVHFAGILAELKDVKEGKTSAGIPYISFSGAIQCGESAVNTVRFRTFVKSKKSDGTDSKNYSKVKEWVANAVPYIDDAEEQSYNDNPTYVDARGSITDHPYVNKDGKLVEATEYSLQFFGDFTEFAAEIDLEGFVHSFTDEVKGEAGEQTGRKKMRLITRDFFGNTLDMNNIIVPESLVEALDDNGYERGCTALFFMNLVPNKSSGKVKSGGIGTQRVEGGKPYLEMVLDGADPVIDSDSEDALNPKLIKAAMTERQSHLAEIQDAGYLGNKSDTTQTVSGAARKGVGAAKKTTTKKEDFEEVSSPIPDDDFPF